MVVDTEEASSSGRPRNFFEREADVGKAINVLEVALTEFGDAFGHSGASSRVDNESGL